MKKSGTQTTNKSDQSKGKAKRECETASGVGADYALLRKRKKHSRRAFRGRFLVRKSASGSERRNKNCGKEIGK